MSWSVNFEVEETSCWLIFVNTIGSKQRYRWIYGTMICQIWLSLKPWFSLSEFELKWTESCMRWKNRISATRSLFSVQKQKKQEIFPKNWNRCMVCNIYVTFVTYVWSFDVFCLSLEQQARLETKSGQIGSQGKPTQTMRLEKEGKHFFWTSLHFFWTWTLLLDLTTILLEMATLLLDLHTLLLDLILPSCSTWPFPKPYPFRINSTVSVQPRLHRNFSDSRALELR